MSHKTMIDGVAYEISGGKTLVGGTAYSIDKGKTLVGGTAYEVGFAPDTVILTITTKRNRTTLDVYETYTSLHIMYTTPEGVSGTLETYEDGKYVIRVGDYEFPVGTTIVIESEYADDKIDQYIYLNGTQVEYSNNYISYHHTLTTNTVITETERSYLYTRIDITEE